MRNGKGLAALIVAKAAKPDEKDEMKVTGSEGPESAAEDLIVALRDKDPKAVVAAFKALRDCCAEDCKCPKCGEECEECCAKCGKCDDCCEC